MLSISVENVSKLYHLGTIDRKVLWREAAAALGLRTTRQQAEETMREEFWALRDVSFEIPQGETVGIIGANGAGKSTLLKILSRITTPTTGRVKIAGRIGSLLEVGTGFNPEMTGRENVYLNGAIQGMKKPEIDSKFNEIVGFAGVEKFIDTPVKRYSSGMYVRLAFSVAAFLESEILIVDEVLSVGDQEFQNRCIQRLQDIIREGRTVLFVSHGAGLIRRICKRAICLSKGSILCDDSPLVALEKYQASIKAAGEEGQPGHQPAERDFSQVSFDPDRKWGESDVRLIGGRVLDSRGNPARNILTSEGFVLEFAFEVRANQCALRPAAVFSDEVGDVLFWSGDTSLRENRRMLVPGFYQTRLSIPPRLLSPGTVVISFDVGEDSESARAHAQAMEALRVRIVDDLEDRTIRGAYKGPLPGMIRPKLDWTTEKCPRNA
jgi:lipopolysaccharide transport system ATP-binding protein